MNTNKKIYVYENDEDDDDDNEYGDCYDDNYNYEYKDDCPVTLTNLMKLELIKVLKKYQPDNRKKFKNVNKLTYSMLFDLLIDNGLIKYIMFDENDGLLGNSEKYVYHHLHLLMLIV